jgi:hypothetical protein
MATTQDFGGLLFGMGGSGLEEYLTPQQTQGIQNQAMLQAAAALLSAGGPSARPVSLGQALGGALQAGQQGYQTAQQGAIQNLLAGQKLREAKIATDLQKRVAETLMGGGEVPEGTKPEDLKFNQYMKLADMYAAVGKGEEAKRFQDMAYQIKPRAEVTGSPFEVTGVDGKPLLVQQMKDGSIKTVEGFGPKRDVVLQNLGGRTVAIDRSKLTGGESYAQTLAPQIVGGAETGYYAIGGGGGGMPSAGGVPRTPTAAPAGAAMPTGQVVPPAAPTGAVPTAGGPVPIIAGTGTKPQEAFMKGAKQLNDLRGALADYKTELESGKWVVPKNIPLPFSETGIPLPVGEDTATVAGKYNSLLMGVKNLYELGALTGPDMSIIERQLTNPASWSGLLTSKNAMNAQVKVLEDMLTRAEENLASAYRQTMPAASMPSGKPKEFVWVNGQLVEKK